MMNICCLFWQADFMRRPWRTPGRAGLMFADPDAESEPEARCCIICRTPFPSTARADAQLCSATCRQRARRQGIAQHRPAAD
jgi:hypothetical protein